MASHFRWYGDTADMTVPFNRTYSYPSEANKALKNVTRIYPKNKTDFSPGQEIRIDLPSDGFLDPATTLLEFDVTLEYTPVSANDFSIIRFQNNIQSMFQRVRWEYGSSPFEDIQRYNQLVRMITDHCGTGQTGGMDQMSITDGVAKAVWGVTGGYPSTEQKSFPAMVNGRQSAIQGISLQTAAFDYRDNSNSASKNFWAGNGWGGVPCGIASEGNPDVKISVTRRYVVPLALGILQQKKLYPLKFTAQNTIVITLAQASECIFWQKGATATISDALPASQTTTLTEVSASPPTYQVSNVALITETLHFDAAYSESFIEGLKNGGVPLKFASFNYYSFASAKAATQTISIPENNRSIKAVFVMQNRDAGDITKDTGASLFDTSPKETGLTSMVEFQFKVGTKVYPSQPVQCCRADNQGISNGGAEAYTNLAKALNIIGDQRLSTTIDVLNWTSTRGVLIGGADTNNAMFQTSKYVLNEYDGKYSAIRFDSGGSTQLMEAESTYHVVGQGTGDNEPGAAVYGGRCISGNWSSCQFVMAFNFETSNGLEISGLNAQEQSDIHLTMKWNEPQGAGFCFNAFTYYDAMIIFLENNVTQLVK